MTQYALPTAPESPPAEPFDPTPEAMRRAMGAFASGVTVVTAVADGEPVGFTCQSFASVSLEPPLVMFCAGRQGRAWGQIRTADALCINVLSEEQIDLCGRFGSRTGARFEGLEHELSAWGAPSLPGALLRVHGTLEDVHVAGDHDIAVCRVVGLELGAEVAPLVFHRGRFGLQTQRPIQPADLWGWTDRWG